MEMITQGSNKSSAKTVQVDQSCLHKHMHTDNHRYAGVVTDMRLLSPLKQMCAMGGYTRACQSEWFS